MKLTILTLIFLTTIFETTCLEPSFDIHNGAKGVQIYSYNYNNGQLLEDSKWLHKKIKCNEHGKIIEEIEYEFGSTESTRKIWKYDLNSNLIEEIYFDNEENVIQTLKNTYDSLGNLILKHFIFADISEEKHLIEYNKKNITYEMLETKNKFGDEISIQVSIKKYIYDSNDLLTKLIDYSQNDTSISEYFYENNKLSKTVLHYDKNKTTTELTEYDTNGKIHSTISLNYKNQPINKQLYFYFDEFYVQEYYAYLDNLEHLSTKQKLDYKDNMLENIGYDLDGSIETKTHQIFDAKGNIIETSFIKKNKVIHRSQNKLDESNSLIEVIFYDKANNLSRKLEFVYEF